MNTTTTAAPKRPLGFWIIGLFALVWNLIGFATFVGLKHFERRRLRSMRSSQF